MIYFVVVLYRMGTNVADGDMQPEEIYPLLHLGRTEKTRVTSERLLVILSNIIFEKKNNKNKQKNPHKLDCRTE